MDMAPRWAGGYGFQIQYESFGSDRMRTEDYSTLDSTFFQNTVWFEGVYTWNRSIRATFKLPYNQISAEKYIVDEASKTSKHRGIGDLILGIPLKKYFNMDRSTINVGITPQVQLATGKSSGIQSSYTGYGLSLSYSAEDPIIYQLYDMFGWINNDGSKFLGLDVNLGWHPFHNNQKNQGLFIMWDVSGRIKLNRDDSDSQRLFTGPQFVIYKENVMARSVLKYPVYENQDAQKIVTGIIFQTGIGFVF